MVTSFDLKYTGMTGNTILDQNGDREPDYWITDMDENGLFVKIAEVINIGPGERVRNSLINLPKLCLIIFLFMSNIYVSIIHEIMSAVIGV